MSTKKARPVLCEAVRSLRKALGDSQMEFANRLGLHLATIALYETKREPSGHELVKLAELAREKGLAGPAKVFHSALLEGLGALPAIEVSMQVRCRNETEVLWVSSLLAALRTPDYAGLLPELTKLLAKPAEAVLRSAELHQEKIRNTDRVIALARSGRSVEQIAAETGIDEARVRMNLSWQRLIDAFDEAKRGNPDAKKKKRQ
jgi:transcriptional regulator with XRE-family HTH domain